MGRGGEFRTWVAPANSHSFFRFQNRPQVRVSWILSDGHGDRLPETSAKLHGLGHSEGLAKLLFPRLPKTVASDQIKNASTSQLNFERAA